MITKSQVKYIQSLGQKKFRELEGAFVAEGPKIINELLDANAHALIQLYATDEWLEANPRVATQFAAKITASKPSELERISFLPSPNGALGIFRIPAAATNAIPEKLFLILDGIQDPGNLGTIIRIADWFGIGHIYCSLDVADAYAPKVVQSSMGSIARLGILYTDLPAFAAANPQIPLYAASLHGNNLQDIGKISTGALVIGNESKGIRQPLLGFCQQKITIPRIGHAESLNAAVATGIILSHII
jgi:RNA methyltransferase, TrmH family